MPRAEAARSGPASREVAAIGQTSAHKKLLQSLQVYLPHASTGATVTLPKPAAGPPKSRIYEVDMRLDPKILHRGMDPALLLRDLTELGEVMRITTHLDTLPPFGEMDPVSCYVGWNVVLSTERPRDDIEGVFIFSSEDDRIKITDITEGAGRRASLLPAEMKLGELLVEEGVVRERDVAVSLGAQKRLGEVLVGLGKVTKESLDRVLEKQGAARKTRNATTIRVDTDKLDKLVNLVGEMVIAVAQVTQTARDPAASEASRIASVETLDQISRDLQGQVMSVRMVPIEETFNRFHRATRDLARELGKLVVLEMEGTETELDKIVIEQLADPLKHMVRNALAHGIESPEERKKAGQSDTGRIHLSAAQRQGKVVIEVQDDGRGIDTAAVLKKARSLGVTTDDAKLTDAQIYDFMFRPGFSTAKQVDEISGRGVGLDVVARNVADLRGSIEIESVLGRGTTFRIQLPLTLAIIEGMHVQVGHKTLTIPLLSVVELISARPEGIHTVEGKGELVDVRGEYLPMFRLSSVLDASPPEPCTADSVVVVVENERRKFGIMVDRWISTRSRRSSVPRSWARAPSRRWRRSTRARSSSSRSPSSGPSSSSRIRGCASATRSRRRRKRAPAGLAPSPPSPRSSPPTPSWPRRGPARCRRRRRRSSSSARRPAEPKRCASFSRRCLSTRRGR